MSSMFTLFMCQLWTARSGCHQLGVVWPGSLWFTNLLFIFEESCPCGGRQLDNSLDNGSFKMFSPFALSEDVRSRADAWCAFAWSIPSGTWTGYFSQETNRSSNLGRKKTSAITGWHIVDCSDICHPKFWRHDEVPRVTRNSNQPWQWKSLIYRRLSQL